MLSKERQLSEIVGYNFFCQAGLEFARDAWVAATVASILRESAVRLVAAEYPDCEMRTDGATRTFEITEADLPGRRRGDEYRALIDGPRGIIHDSEETVRDRANAIPSILADASSRKASKGYGEDCGLIIYLNVADHDWHRDELEDCLPAAVSDARSTFCETIILKGDRLYIFSDKIRERPFRIVDASSS